MHFEKGLGAEGLRGYSGRFVEFFLFGCIEALHRRGRHPNRYTGQGNSSKS
jgi:hypothetical protein